MVRSKVKYEFIADERARRVTYRKRKNGFLKKLDEIKTLCSIDACAIVLNEDGSSEEVWPSQPEAERVIEKFRRLPQTSQINNMADQTGFLEHDLTKISNNLDREKKKVRELEMELRLAECMEKDAVDDINLEDLSEMLRLLESKIQAVDWRLEDIESAYSTSEVTHETMSEPYLDNGKKPL